MRNTLIAVLLLMAICLASHAQRKKEEKPSYIFSNKITHAVGPVQSQDRTGTCWSYATISFIESELMRKGKGSHELSEMFVVRHVYPQKAINYVRFHGKTNFSQGGQAHDVMKAIDAQGLVPRSVYHGINYGLEKHSHGELEAVLGGMLDGVLRRRGGNPTTAWLPAIESVLDVYLGKSPESFSYQDQNFTPLGFAEEMGISSSDYIELTSYSHHPFYQPFVLEVPDNWSKDLYYNLPIDELMELMHYAIENGFTICWDGDVSERSFSHKEGLAVWPVKPWDDMTEDERKSIFAFPHEEESADQEKRQVTFDNFASTDDHLMHITGRATDQNGTHYFLTKNSWGTEGNDMGGYLYMSEPYVRLKTIAIMVHKDAIPPDLAQKLGL